jgi:hypothetical protein
MVNSVSYFIFVKNNLIFMNLIFHGFLEV